MRRAVMKYLKTTDNRFIILDEKALLENGEIPSIEDLSSKDIFPLIDEVPEYNTGTHYHEKLPSFRWEKDGDYYRVTYAIKPRSLHALKRVKKEEITQHRWDILTGGVTLPNGIKVGTTNDDQNRISSVVAHSHLAGLSQSSIIDFKAKEGWVKLTIEELEQIVGIIGVHVQKCYSTEKTLHDNVDLLATLEDVASFDVSTNWDLIYLG